MISRVAAEVAAPRMTVTLPFDNTLAAVAHVHPTSKVVRPVGRFCGKNLAGFDLEL